MRLVSFRRHRTRGLGALLPGGDVVDLRAAAAAHLAIVEEDPFAEAEAALRLPAEAAGWLAAGEPGRALAERALAFARAHGPHGGLDGERLVGWAGEVRLAVPLAAPLIVSTGAAYRDRADEASPARERHTEFYLRNHHQVLGPGDDIPLQPWVTKALDAGVALGVVIGRRTRWPTPAQAREAVSGYCVVTDLSAQDQHELSWAGPLFHMQYAQGKAFDGALAVGPALVTRDEVADLASARARLWVDERLVYETALGDLVSAIPRWVAYVSEFVTLAPGSVLVLPTAATTVVGGDPTLDGRPVVRHAPPVAGDWLRPGMRVAAEIDGLGRMESAVREVAADAPPGHR